MKALSLRQPWAWAILHAGKRIENRRWNTHYRGPILLHAAKGCTKDEYISALDWMLDADILGCVVCPKLEDLQRGGIVGRARIVDVIPPRSLPLPATAELHGIDMRWHMPDQYGFVLADVEPLAFIPCKGALGLFEVSALAIAALEAEERRRHPMHVLTVEKDGTTTVRVEPQ